MITRCKRCDHSFEYNGDKGYAKDICSPFCDGILLGKQSSAKRIATLEAERDKYKAANEYLTARLKVDEAEMDKLEAENTRLREIVRELVDAVDQCFGNLAISMDDEILWANTRAKAIALEVTK